MTTDITIRAPREGEWAEIADLLRVCFVDEGPDVGGKVDTSESVAALQRSGNHLLVMESGGKIIGFVYLDSLRRAAFKLAVDSRFRGMDYGKRLMEAAEAKARTLGWQRLLVGVMDTKQSLVTYYNDLGYADTGERYEMIPIPGYAGPTHYFIILGKSLGEGYEFADRARRRRMRSEPDTSNAKEGRKEVARKRKHKRDVVKASRRRNRRKK